MRQVSSDSTYSTTFCNQTGITDTTFQVTNFSYNTKYYWRVKSTAETNESYWSSSGQFTTVQAPPLAPTLSAPANAAENVSLSPALSWVALAAAATYEVQVLTGLTAGATYYWRVQAANAGGTGTWSAAWSFTTIPPKPGVPLITSTSG